MAEAATGKQVWRFQSDPPMGEKDPMVTVFLGELETYDGAVSIRQDTRDPVTMKLSEMVALIATPDKIGELQEKQRADKKEAMQPKEE
jgi:hypothetical protein